MVCASGGSCGRVHARVRASVFRCRASAELAASLVPPNPRACLALSRSPRRPPRPPCPAPGRKRPGRTETGSRARRVWMHRSPSRPCPTRRGSNESAVSAHGEESEIARQREQAAGSYTHTHAHTHAHTHTHAQTHARVHSPTHTERWLANEGALVYGEISTQGFRGIAHRLALGRYPLNPTSTHAHKARGACVLHSVRFQEAWSRSLFGMLMVFLLCVLRFGLWLLERTRTHTRTHTHTHARAHAQGVNVQQCFGKRCTTL